MAKEKEAKGVTWQSLNKRQQDYLTAVYELDQITEANVKNAAARGVWNSTPASVWRWIPYNAADAPLLRRIEDMGYRDRGTGSTFEALERRGLILCRYEWDAFGLSILFVQITKVGRKLVRDALGLQAPKFPPGTLREWHWKALVHAYKAGEGGVLDGWPRGIGDMTIRRLREYRVKGQDCPLIEWVKVSCEPYLCKRWPGDSGYLTDVRKVLRITPFGLHYYREHWHDYQERYPDVQAPQPPVEQD